ncbi:hypothetical protein A1O3_08459 [Capronia epimyces CBS 606.96]|uniref:Copper transport protein n=1 Tax=Capronia epimyces CBS 606.96 TaxID=1182542 RepID=W9Y9A7_9EURO|nr:uncharacterized protein A1O3_08459 [Capronia epimyces CBS 606.96]EXJ78959.1 hypothetical protein A1O3_08459 [Capronia epimyces CBS 606.96]
MDMGSSSTSISTSPSMTTLSTAVSSAAASMTSMGDNSCKISMLWNWDTVGACFISETWHVTTSGGFAGSCIGVICLVISLEFLRRSQREYEASIRRQSQKTARDLMNRGNGSQSASESTEGMNSKANATPVTSRLVRPAAVVGQSGAAGKASLLQRQLIRALLHTVQFGVAYFIMLLAMYYNGYIIICILIGAFIGSFTFTWDQLLNNTERKEEAADITGCCG